MRKLSLIGRLFPRKVVTYLLGLINTIETDESKNSVLSETERVILENYKTSLLDDKRYYVKTNLEFVRAMSPLVTKREAQSDMQFLYSEILRMNPKLISQRLGNELILKKTFK